jgi:hypothetical protein
MKLLIIQVCTAPCYFSHSASLWITSSPHLLAQHSQCIGISDLREVRLSLHFSTPQILAFKTWKSKMVIRLFRKEDSSLVKSSLATGVSHRTEVQYFGNFLSPSIENVITL